MNKIILTVIGGGSVTWMPSLMQDIYLIDELDGGEIRLVDPDIESVHLIKEMLLTFNRLRNKSYDVSVVNDRQEALDGADFVLCTMSPGSLPAFYHDLEIPIKYGIRQPVSMTVGPCGISASLRTVPVAYELVEDMERMCPDAWMLNVTNPMSTVTKAMHIASKKTKIIGMCHEFHAFPSFIEQILGIKKPEDMDLLDFLYQWLPENGFDYTVAGINHFIFLTKAVYRGEDMLPQIRDYCKKNNDIGGNHGAKVAICRQLGYLPIPGDRHLVEFYPSLCNIRNGYAMKYGVKKTTVDHRMRMKEEGLRRIKRVVSGEEQVTWKRSGEEMSSIIRAIVSKKSVTTIVNMPNQGQIANIPEGRVVETFATITADGIQPTNSGELPGSVGSLCRLHSDVHGLTVQAALTGDRDVFVEALSLDPASGTADFSELVALADELLYANKAHLPRFFT